MSPAVTVALFLALLTILSLTTAARAHSWYPASCCSDRDCRPTEAEVVPGGYQLPNGQVIKQEVARPSEDGEFHICEINGVFLCFFAPQTGS